MNLYEITTGYIGESYCRAYAWASSEEEAQLLYYGRGKLHTEPKNIISETKLLFSSDSAPFCTEISDSGWET